MLSDRKRTELLELLAAWDRLIDDDTTDLADEPEIVGRMQAVDMQIRQLCPPVADPLPWAYTPLDTVRPDIEP